jgi:hypothetical protein
MAVQVVIEGVRPVLEYHVLSNKEEEQMPLLLLISPSTNLQSFDDF